MTIDRQVRPSARADHVLGLPGREPADPSEHRLSIPQRPTPSDGAVDRGRRRVARDLYGMRQEREGRGRRAALIGGGTDGNQQLTAQTGAILLVLLAILGVTILRVGQLLSIHMFVGMLLIGPVALKMASTGYRFARYYTLDPSYRKAGPPAPALRLIAPLVVISTVAVFATGVALLLAGPSSRDVLLPLHKASFIVWIAFTAIHVLGHLAEIPGAISSRYERLAEGVAEATEQLPGMRKPPKSALPTDGLREWDAHGTGRTGRMLSLSAALTAGIVLAIVSIAWYGPWLQSVQLFVDK